MKKINLLFLCFVVFLCSMSVLMPVDYALAEGGLKVNPDANALKADIKASADRFANFVRGVAGVITAVCLIVGFVLLKTAFGNQDRVRLSKVCMGGAVLGLVGVFWADKIASLTMGIFGFSA